MAKEPLKILTESMFYVLLSLLRQERCGTEIVQFEPVSNGTVYKTPTAQSVEAARRVLAGEQVIGKALYFYAPALSQGTWINANRTYYKTIGCHRFYL